MRIMKLKTFSLILTALISSSAFANDTYETIKLQFNNSRTYPAKDLFNAAKNCMVASAADTNGMEMGQTLNLQDELYFFDTDGMFTDWISNYSYYPKALLNHSENKYIGNNLAKATIYSFTIESLTTYNIYQDFRQGIIDNQNVVLIREKITDTSGNSSIFYAYCRKP